MLHLDSGHGEHIRAFPRSVRPFFSACSPAFDFPADQVIVCHMRDQSRMTFPAMLASFVSCSLSFFKVNFLIHKPLIQLLSFPYLIWNLLFSSTLALLSPMVSVQGTKIQTFRVPRAQIRHINNSGQIQNNRNKTATKS